MLTAFITVVTGTLVYTIGQMLNNFFLSPIKDYYIIRAEIPAKLIFHANYITNGRMNRDKSIEIAKEIRELAVKLEVNYFKIPCVEQLAALRAFRLVSRQRISDAVGNLYFIANEPGNTNTHENLQAMEKVYRSLGIKKLQFVTKQDPRP